MYYRIKLKALEMIKKITRDKALPANINDNDWNDIDKKNPKRWNNRCKTENSKLI